MSEPYCNECGHILVDINAACPQCLPDWNQPGTVGHERHLLNRAVARAEAAEARSKWLLGALMGVTFPGCGDHGGPLVSITARYEDGSEMIMGHWEQRAASDALQYATATPQTSEAGQSED